MIQYKISAGIYIREYLFCKEVNNHGRKNKKNR